jgi:hypothetical protein
MKKCNKIHYKTEEDAKKHLSKIRLGSTREILPVRAYLCYCGYWHLTKRLDIKEIEKENENLKDLIKKLRFRISSLMKQKKILIKKNKQANP